MCKSRYHVFSKFTLYLAYQRSSHIFKIAKHSRKPHCNAEFHHKSRKEKPALEKPSLHHFPVSCNTSLAVRNHVRITSPEFVYIILIPFFPLLSFKDQEGFPPLLTQTQCLLQPREAEEFTILQSIEDCSSCMFCLNLILPQPT